MNTRTYRLMAVVFGVLMVAALASLFTVLATLWQPQQNPTTTAALPSNAPQGNALVVQNLPGGNSSRPDAGKNAASIAAGLGISASDGGANFTASEILLLPGRCAAAQMPIQSNLTISQLQGFMSGYYLVSASSTLPTFLRMGAMSAEPSPLELTSANFTRLTSMRIAAYSATSMFFCNPTAQNDTVDYAMQFYASR